MSAAKYPVDEFSALIKIVSSLKICSGVAQIFLKQSMLQVKKLEILNTNKTGQISDEDVLQANPGKSMPGNKNSTFNVF